MNWIKKVYNDTGGKIMFAFFLLGGPLFSIVQYYFVSKVWDWFPIELSYGFFFLVVLPICYWQRNTL